MRRCLYPRPSAPSAATLIGETPAGDDPAERLLLGSPAALTDAELVACLIGRGRSTPAAVERARRLLHEADGLSGLRTAERVLLRRLGLTDTRAAGLLAAVELARRLALAEIPARDPLARPGQVALWLTLRYAVRDQEVLGALFLDVRNRLLACREIYRGTLHQTQVEPREILKEALLRGATGFVLFHTHPSGDPTPSVSDLTYTRKMAKAAEAIGVKLIDHLILAGGGAWLSMLERGGW
jgi:DNA repair protein RadC